mmetsp:Transcript_85338/g.222695  ORF Transcript_85338/g.222695 Transcript_85338/m.222695 type:complete len:293 (+) Transcript_85338:126-1004(+)
MPLPAGFPQHKRPDGSVAVLSAPSSTDTSPDCAAGTNAVPLRPAHLLRTSPGVSSSAASSPSESAKATPPPWPDADITASSCSLVAAPVAFRPRRLGAARRAGSSVTSSLLSKRTLGRPASVSFPEANSVICWSAALFQVSFPTSVFCILDAWIVAFFFASWSSSSSLLSSSPSPCIAISINCFFVTQPVAFRVTGLPSDSSDSSDLSAFFTSSCGAILTLPLELPTPRFVPSAPPGRMAPRCLADTSPCSSSPSPPSLSPCCRAANNWSLVGTPVAFLPFRFGAGVVDSSA